MKELEQYIDDQLVTIYVSKEEYEYARKQAIENLGLTNEEIENNEYEIEQEVLEYFAEEFESKLEKMREEASKLYSDLNSWYSGITGV